MPEEAKKPEPLTVQQRAERVLTNQGRPAAMLPSFPETVQDALAALCDDTGTFADGSWAKARAILGEHFAAMKAVVGPDESPAPPIKEAKA